MQNKFTKAVIDGLILSVVFVVFSLVLWLMNINIQKGWVGFVSLAIVIACLVYFVRGFKAQAGEAATFGSVFLYVFLVFLIYSIVSIGFNYLYIYVLNDYATVYEQTVETSLGMLRKMNALSDEMEETMRTEIAKNLAFTMGNVIKMLVMNLVMGAVVSAIFAAIMKHRKPVQHNINV